MIHVNDLAKRVLAMCHKRKWDMHWTARGAYLHLESSEFIEALRGKRGNRKDEAADVLLVLMSMTENEGIPFTDVVATANEKCAFMETRPQYAGESTVDGDVLPPRTQQKQ